MGDRECLMGVDPAMENFTPSHTDAILIDIEEEEDRQREETPDHSLENDGNGERTNEIPTAEGIQSENSLPFSNENALDSRSSFGALNEIPDDFGSMSSKWNMNLLSYPLFTEMEELMYDSASRIKKTENEPLVTDQIGVVVAKSIKRENSKNFLYVYTSLCNAETDMIAELDEKRFDEINLGNWISFSSRKSEFEARSVEKRRLIEANSIKIIPDCHFTRVFGTTVLINCRTMVSPAFKNDDIILHEFFGFLADPDNLIKGKKDNEYFLTIRRQRNECDQKHSFLIVKAANVYKTSEKGLEEMERYKSIVPILLSTENYENVKELDTKLYNIGLVEVTERVEDPIYANVYVLTPLSNDEDVFKLIKSFNKQTPINIDAKHPEDNVELTRDENNFPNFPTYWIRGFIMQIHRKHGKPLIGIKMKSEWKMDRLALGKVVRLRAGIVDTHLEYYNNEDFWGNPHLLESHGVPLCAMEVSDGKRTVPPVPNNSAHNFENRIDDTDPHYDDNHGEPLFPNKLNEVQRKALNMAMNNKRNMVYVHGPPGTGKTKTLTEIIVNMIKRNIKMIVCAPTHVAVENVFDMTKSRLQSLGINTDLLYPAMHEDEEVLMRSSHFQNMIDQRKNAELAENKENENAALREMDRLRNKIIANRLEMTMAYFSTITKTALPKLHANGFDAEVVVIDEAAQILDENIWPVIHKSERVILAGDHHQLPPVIKKDRKKEADKTLLNRFDEETLPLKNNKIMLMKQYRMNENIMKWSSKCFYDDQLEADASVANRHLEAFTTEENCAVLGPLVFADYYLDVANYESICEKYSERVSVSSKCNEGEAELVCLHLIRLLNAGIAPGAIGIITPYSAQVETIRSLMQSLCVTERCDPLIRLTPEIQRKALEVHVDTVDAFQGQERDVIIISFVRNNKNYNIGFLSDVKRINVAITRAKLQVMMIGSSQLLWHSGVPAYQDLLRTVKEHGCFISARHLAGFARKTTLPANYTFDEATHVSRQMKERRISKKKHQDTLKFYKKKKKNAEKKKLERDLQAAMEADLPEGDTSQEEEIDVELSSRPSPSDVDMLTIDDE
ncbi:unnamed protein product [Caenorhabditis auriculariae]|uniref:Helicase ATP-binding domain-containing protein n=1 Tax=Caenorhabditis auriculariae TaxID=2777116 RepID=A0A8S1GRV0_9PELO|nr:unnamed protein product [Caenorhabditis auriculariae]